MKKCPNCKAKMWNNGTKGRKKYISIQWICGTKEGCGFTKVQRVKRGAVK